MCQDLALECGKVWGCEEVKFGMGIRQGIGWGVSKI